MEPEVLIDGINTHEQSESVTDPAVADVNEHELGAGAVEPIAEPVVEPVADIVGEGIDYASVQHEEEVQPAEGVQEPAASGMIRVVFEPDTRDYVFACVNGEGHKFPVGEEVTVAEHIADLIGNYTRAV